MISNSSRCTVHPKSSRPAKTSRLSRGRTRFLDRNLRQSQALQVAAGAETDSPIVSARTTPKPTPPQPSPDHSVVCWLIPSFRPEGLSTPLHCERDLLGLDNMWGLGARLEPWIPVADSGLGSARGSVVGVLARGAGRRPWLFPSPMVFWPKLHHGGSWREAAGRV